MYRQILRIDRHDQSKGFAQLSMTELRTQTEI